jgi:hypothetical protein
VPAREILAGEFDALLLTVMLPAAAPLAEGANVELSVVDCPGAKIIPLAPVALKPAPATITCAIVTFAVPTLVIVTLWMPLFATVTLPKFMLLVLEFSSKVPAATVKLAWC